MEEAAVADAFKTYGGAVFVRCFDRRGGLRAGRELLAWLYRVATNLCLNALRDGKTRREADRQLASAAPTVAEAPEARLLWDILRDLDERTQAIVIYVYVDGMTHAEAAEVAQVTDRTVRNCLARFQRTGRQRLGTDYGPPQHEGSK